METFINKLILLILNNMRGTKKMRKCTVENCTEWTNLSDKFFCTKHREVWRKFCNKNGWTDKNTDEVEEAMEKFVK